MKNPFKFLTFSLLIAVVISSCNNDDDNFINIPTSLGEYENGILVSSEGGTISGSVSFISNDLSITENTIFSNANAEELGTYVQSIGFHENQAYIVVDNNNIHVVNRYSFVKQATISNGLSLPRYIAFANGKAYVSNWADGFNPADDFIAVVNLETNIVETTIPVAEGPEQMLVYASKLYISHKGGYGSNNSISVMDLATNAVNTITVNDVPDEMFINSLNELVVLCEGNPAWTGNETTASITKIDLSTDTVSETLSFTDGIHPTHMSYSNGNLYYQANNEVFVMADSDTTLPITSIINLGTTTTYGMTVKAGKLYITDAKDYASLSDLLVYDLSTNTKTNTFEVGLVASKIYFN